MDRMDFIQGVTRTRVLENKLLSRARIERMVDAKDIDEVLKVLGETEYANSVSSLSRPENYEEILSFELKRIYKLMREISKHDVVVDLMALKYDYHNMKVLMKENILKKDLSHLYINIGTTDFSKIKSGFLAGNYRDIDPDFKQALTAATNDYESTKDPQRIDIILDKFYFEHLYKMAKETNIELFINYVKDQIDLINIKTTIRLKKQGKEIKFLEDVLFSNGNIDKKDILHSLNDTTESIMHKFKNYRISSHLIKGLESYQETNRLSDLEKHMDNYLMNINKSSKNVNFGPEPIFSYIVAKEAEIKTLRIILVSKLNKLSPDAIRERLRDLYV